MLLAATGRKQEAIAEAQRALDVDPLSIPVNNMIATMYMIAGDLTRCIEQLRKTIEMDPNVWLPHENLGTALEETGQTDEAAHYAFLGEVDQALTWLERANAARSGTLVWILLYPHFKNLNSSPRFHDLVRAVGLPQP